MSGPMNGSMNGAYAIEGTALTRPYGGFFAVNKVDIAVPHGEIRGLIGPNGAGKSTLIDVLSGRAAVWSGQVRMDSRDIGAMGVQERRRHGMARSFQKTNIFPELSVREQLDIAARQAEKPNVHEVMDELGLTGLGDARARDIAYGEQRRLDLAAAARRAGGRAVDAGIAGARHPAARSGAALEGDRPDRRARHGGGLLHLRPHHRPATGPRPGRRHAGRDPALARGRHRLSRECGMSELLAFSNVVAGYGGARILHDLDLRIDAGERVAVLGRNGVGKTTIVNAFLGIARRMQGEIRLAGKAVGDIRHFTAARAGISVVPQGRCIIPNLTVRENLILGAAVRRKGAWTIERVFAMFPILKERADTPGTALSGGQQQMLAIGRALMANPHLLVLDEPSEGLAPVIVDELADNLRHVADGGTGLLIIEQNYSLVRRVAERYYVLSKGEVAEQGAMAGLTKESLKKHIAV
ncbi:ATP-binding cassette domain-containing protein [Azospirillum brasilense]|nr:ATP-binding cassette domain-containing protein [Azospirillum brasilense]